MGEIPRRSTSVVIAPAPQGFRPKGEIPRRHSSIKLARILRKVLTVEIYSHGMPEKISICLNRGREDSEGSDDVSTVRARKYIIKRRSAPERDG